MYYVRTVHSREILMFVSVIYVTFFNCTYKHIGIMLYIITFKTFSINILEKMCIRDK